MKKLFLQTSLLCLIYSSVLFSQILNSGFENWTDGEPDNWWSNNVPGVVTGVTQSNESHSGNYAARLDIVDLGGSPYFPLLFAGGDDDGFPVSQRYASLRGYYKFIPTIGTQAFTVSVTLLRLSEYVGGGNFIANTAVANYAEFNCAISYVTSDIPDTVLISIQVIDVSGLPNPATALVDDLSLSGSVDVKEISNNQLPNSYNLLQNYPNPFNPSTKIEYAIHEESFVSLKVYNLIGQEVATLVNQNQKAGTYRADFNADGMQSGIYIAKLNAGGFTRSVKMTLLK